jgi:hypothetical protein
MTYPKPEPRKKTKARKKRAKAKNTKSIRAAVFNRDGYVCRCCDRRQAESMHEIVPRSLGGKVSMENSIAVCGSGTTGCHGKLQQHKIDVFCGSVVGAEGALLFVDRS